MREYRTPSGANFKIANSGQLFGEDSTIPYGLDIAATPYTRYIPYAPNKIGARKFLSRQLREAVEQSTIDYMRSLCDIASTDNDEEIVPL
jgi:hypothetical protein